MTKIASRGGGPALNLARNLCEAPKLHEIRSQADVVYAYCSKKKNARARRVQHFH